jgi:hypothetical protein
LGDIVIRRMRVGLRKQRVLKSIGMCGYKLRGDCEDLVALTKGPCVLQDSRNLVVSLMLLTNWRDEELNLGGS